MAFWSVSDRAGVSEPPPGPVTVPITAVVVALPLTWNCTTTFEPCSTAPLITPVHVVWKLAVTGLQVRLWTPFVVETNRRGVLPTATVLGAVAVMFAVNVPLPVLVSVPVMPGPATVQTPLVWVAHATPVCP